MVGDATFGKGVFQQVLELSNGGALDITAGQYFTPERAQPRRTRRQDRSRASRPTSRPTTTRRPRRDEALRKALDVLAAKLK